MSMDRSLAVRNASGPLEIELRPVGFGQGFLRGMAFNVNAELSFDPLLYPAALGAS